MKNLSKILLVLSFLFILTTPALARHDPLQEGINIIDKSRRLALSNQDPRVVAVMIINIVLSFLGLIALVVVLFGGFKWMTSGGNQEQIGQAKKMLIAGLIGLVIVLLSWGITTFVINQVAEITK